MSSALVGAQEVQVVLKEDFTTNQRQWRQLTGEEYFSKIKDNHYFIRNKRSKGEIFGVSKEKFDLYGKSQYVIQMVFSVKHFDPSSSFGALGGMLLMKNAKRIVNGYLEPYEGMAIGILAQDNKYYLFINNNTNNGVGLKVPINPDILNKDVSIQLRIDNTAKKIVVYLNKQKYGVLPYGLYSIRNVGFKAAGDVYMRIKGLAIATTQQNIVPSWDINDYYLIDDQSVFVRGFNSIENDYIPKFMYRDDLSTYSHEQLDELLAKDSKIKKLKKSTVYSEAMFSYEFEYQSKKINLSRNGNSFNARVYIGDSKSEMLSFIMSYLSLKDISEIDFSYNKPSGKIYSWKGTTKSIRYDDKRINIVYSK